MREGGGLLASYWPGPGGRLFFSTLGHKRSFFEACNSKVVEWGALEHLVTK